MITNKPSRGIKHAQNRTQLLTIATIMAICVTGYASRFLRLAAADTSVDRFPIQVHDFGTMMPNSKYPTTFSTKNNYSDSIVIDRIDRSCGCTSATCNRTTILPGQTFSINAVLSTRDYPESVTSLITVHGRTGGRRIEAEFQLHGDVETLIRFPETGEGDLSLGTWTFDLLPA
jgi:hypothetical protein